MRNFVKNRIIPIVLVVTIMVTMVVPFASAAFPAGFADTGERDRWTYFFNTGSATSVVSNRLLDHYTGGTLLVSDFLWFVMDRQIGRPAGDIQKTRLFAFCDQLNSIFRDDTCASTFWGDFKDIFVSDEDEQFKKEHNAFTAFGLKSPQFDVLRHPSTGFWRVKDVVNNLWVTNSRGEYPYSDPTEDAGDKWVGERTCSNQVSGGQVIILDDHVLRSMQSMLLTEGTPCIVRSLGNYNAIWYNQQYYCDAMGRPYVAQKNPDNFAVNQDRPAVDTEPEESPSVDIPGMIMVTPDNGLLFIDEIIYDEGTKSYYFDSHDTYNTEENYYITYNYSWTYHINYTSITYIGQTEEYNKYYEVYYELPDGRSSADLTREELEQLNVSVDVIPYGRSADDTSLRSLYHFDGDTRDASYWNYCTDFTWNKGSSLTYMDAGVFNGALYLDEQEHDFTLTFPSAFTTEDFTLQFRYYQSYTAAPQTDSYIKFGDSTVFQFNGVQFFNGSGTALANTPIGTWNEIALIRDSGTLYYYLNGLSIGSSSLGYLLNTITFHFGSSQQTYKYFDELRVLNYALQNDGLNYTPTSVPFDTNLTLVLPTDSVPIADEYWNIGNDSQKNLIADYSDWTSNNLNISYDTYSYSCVSEYGSTYSKSHPGLDTRASFKPYIITNGTTLKLYDSGASLTRNDYTLGSSPVLTPSLPAFVLRSLGNSDVRDSALPTCGLIFNLGYYYQHYMTKKISFTTAGSDITQGSSYVFSMVDEAGNIGSLNVTIPSSFTFGAVYQDSIEFNGYKIGYYFQAGVNSDQCFGCPFFLYVYPTTSGTEGNIFRYLELVKGDSTNLKAEFVQSVVPMTPDQLNTPTLAVRTDIDITSYQIGGVRPSLPKKGQVWAMVESGYITSIQVYNGSAWEGCDGRIWTGQRWIPARSYNVITLQDMYDVADATPNYEYIYSESGFWSWWQKSWNSFVERFFASGGGSGASSSVPSSVKDTLASALSALIEGVFGLITEVLKSLISAATDLISGFFGFLSEKVLGGVKDFFSSFGDLLSPFQSTVTNEDGTSSTITELPEGIPVVFAFFSGLFLVIPEELRFIMIFGIGLMLLLSVFKMVKE